MRKLTLFITLTIFSLHVLATTNTPLKKTDWLYWPVIQFGGSYQTRNNSFADTNVLLPVFYTENNLFYITSHASYRELGRMNGDAGFGWRHMLGGRQWLLDIHANYNRLKSLQRTWFTQYIIGGRVQTLHWDVDANYYMPTKNNIRLVSLNSKNDSFQNVQILNGFATIMPGGDAQIGYHFSDIPGLGIYAGGYYFHRSGFKTIAGPQMHVNFDLHNPFDFHGGWANLFYKIGFETGTYYDKQNKFAWHVGLRWTIAFDTDDLTGIETHMTDPNWRLFN